jgi:serine/threonine protein kinase/tetratricopeptide (TPR) repeat protein
VADLLDSLRQALADRYEVERVLGQGGFATVYLGFDRRHHRRVAIKFLLPEVALAFGPDRFLREIELAASLTHPHILPIFDSGSVRLTPGGAEEPYYVMPFIEGLSLRERLSREGQIPMEDAFRITRQIGAALAHAHSRGVIHRDVKPENILLQGEETLLADFGIACPIDAGTRQRMTRSGITIGTPAYMSPEQASGDSRLDARSDQYSLAVVLYEMLGGEAPFSASTPQAVLARQLTGMVPPLTPVRRSVSEALDVTIRRALAPSPADRYADIPAFLSALDSPVAPPPPKRRTVRHPALISGVLAVAAAILFLLLRPHPVSADRRLGIAVMPFRTTPDATRWAETLPDLLSTLLDGTPGVRVADPWSLWRTLRTEPAAVARSPDPEEAGRLAKKARASRFVLGSVDAVGGQLNLTLRIYGPSEPEPIATIRMAARTDSSAELVGRAAVAVIQKVDPERTTIQVPAVEQYLTASPEALKAYLAAREAFRRGLFDSADVAISSAIKLDTTFAMAYVAAANIRSYLQMLRGQPFSGLRELNALARHYGDSLGERERLRLEAASASIETDGPRAAAALSQLLERDSGDFEAMNALSYMHLVYGWQYGATLQDILRVAERAVELDSTDMQAQFRRAQISVSTGDRAEVEHQIRRFRALDTSNSLIRGALHATEALLLAEPEFTRRLTSYAAERPFGYLLVFRRLRAYRPDRALQLIREVRRSSGPGPAFEMAARSELGLLVPAGQLRRADSLANSPALVAVEGIKDAVARALLANALWGFQDSALTARIVGELEVAYPVDSALARIDRQPIWIVSHLLGAWHASWGDTLKAIRWRDEARKFPKGDDPPDWGESIAEAIEGRLLDRRGDSAAARAHHERAFQLWRIHTENQIEETPEPHLRFRFAESLLSQGLTDSAATIFRSLTTPTAWLGGHTARAWLRLGEIEERRRNRTEAARMFDHALRLWENGGPEVDVWKQRAAAGVRRNSTGVSLRYGS